MTKLNLKGNAMLIVLSQGLARKSRYFSFSLETLLCISDPLCFSSLPFWCCILFLFGCVHAYMHNIIWVQHMAESRVPNCFSHTYIGRRKVFSLHCSGHFWLLSRALLPLKIKLVLTACISACTVELYWLDPSEKIYKWSGEARTWMYN